MHAQKSDTKHISTLSKRADFLRLNHKSKRWTAHGLVLQAMPNDLPDQIRVGFTVTKRIDKRAVYRNRMKRRLRAAAMDVLSGDNIPRGYDYVLIARPQTITRPYDALCSDLKWCLGKLGLI